jgi:hypothetical protein
VDGRGIWEVTAKGGEEEEGASALGIVRVVDLWIGLGVVSGIAIVCAVVCAWCCWKTRQAGNAIVDTLLDVFPALARGQKIEEEIAIPMNTFMQPPPPGSSKPGKKLRVFHEMSNEEIMRKKRRDAGLPDEKLNRQVVAEKASEEYHARAGM